MQYALVDGKRSEARKGAGGTCETCGAQMVPKCGPRVMHHWAHSSRRDCDPWWENETPWHREWKQHFPEDCREVSHVDAEGEIHRADIKTPTEIVIEVQHSTISESERESRELFYRNLIWILDGKGFRKNFHLGCMLPDPSVDIFRDVVWHKFKRSAYNLSPVPEHECIPCFSRISEISKDYPGATKSNLGNWPDMMMEMHSSDELKEEAIANYRGHHQFHWVRPRKGWLDATCPVYLDFGEDILFKLETYDETGMNCVKLVAKRKLVHDAMVETRAVDIATRFYPI